MVLAIGLQLMISGVGLAAHACGDSLDRTGIRRLSDSVAQALRDISERTIRETGRIEAAPDWDESVRSSVPGDLAVCPAADWLPNRVLPQPPPSAC